jgi:hypothetical protein
VNSKWEKIGRHKERFLHYNSSWLNEEIGFDSENHSADETVEIPSAGFGRPAKSFNTCAPSTKRQKVKHLLQSTSAELSIAAGIKLRKEGKRDSAAIVKELCCASPNRGTVIKKVRRSVPQKQELLPEQALALMVDINLSSRQYKLLRAQATTFNCKLYPPYYKVKESKQLCYPQGVVISNYRGQRTIAFVRKQHFQHHNEMGLRWNGTKSLQTKVF